MQLLAILSTTLVSLTTIGKCHSEADIPAPKLFGRHAAADVRARISNSGGVTAERGGEPEATVMRRASCGPNQGSCPAGQCCSAEGVCGIGRSFCSGPDCQFQYGPACDANTTPGGSSTEMVPRPKLGKYLYGGAGIYDCNIPNTISLTYDDGWLSLPILPCS
jgi:hypothetical protein